MDRGAKCWVTILSQHIDPMPLQEISQTPFPNDNNINKKKREEKLTGRWHAKDTHVTQTGCTQ